MKDQCYPVFAVFLNELDGMLVGIEYCDVCGKKASIVNMGGIWCCAKCLETGRKALSHAINSKIVKA